METPQPMGGLMTWWVGFCWVGGWVGPCQIIKNRINLDLIKIIQFCLKIYDLLRHPYAWVVLYKGGLMGGSMDAVFPIFPMLSLSFSCHPCHHHIVPVIPTSSPNPHLTPQTNPNPTPTWGTPRISKNSITLEQIKIF